MLENSLQLLDEWENEVDSKKLSKDDFLTPQTAQGLRVTLKSTIELCRTLISTYGFMELHTGRVNQDSLEVWYKVPSEEVRKKYISNTMTKI